MGKNAQIITRMSKNVAVLARKNNVAVILISQVRADFKSVQGFDTFAGPKGMKHANSMVIKFSRTGTPALTIKEGSDTIPVGIEFKGKVDRSKCGPGGRSGTFVVLNQDTEKWGPVGLDSADETVAVIDLFGLATKRGSWYDLPDGSSHNGREALKVYLRDNPELIQTFRKEALATKAHEVTPDVEVEFVAEEAS
jgi:recombination protein RecA